MFKLSRVVILAGILWFSVCSPLLAENDVDTETKKVTKTTVLEDITIKERGVLGKLSGELAEFGHSVEFITGRQIEEAGFVDLTKAIQAMVPGIFSSSRQGRGGWTSTYLHGSDDILFLLDGVRMTNPLNASDWSTTISIHQVERIEVLKGGESVFYGSNARAGIINIITKPIEENTKGEVGVSVGQLDYMDTYAHITDTVGGHGFMFFGSVEESDGYQVCDNEAFANSLNDVTRDRNVGYDRSVVGAKYQKEFDLSGSAVLRAQAQRQQGLFEYPYPHYRSAYNEYEENIVTLNWEHEVNPNFSYHLKSYAHTWWGNVTFIALDGSYAWGDRSNATVWGYEDMGASLTTSATWGQGHELISGVDYRTYWGKEKVVRVARTDRTNAYAGFASFRPHLAFSPKTKTAVGVRYTTTNEDMNSFIWDFSLKTPLWDPLYFRVNAGTSISLPTLLQLYGTTDNGGTLGNPDLDPEESKNLEVGIGGDWQFFNAEFGYFFQNVDDMISSATLPSGINTYQNADGKTEIRGFEVQAGIGPYAGFSLNLSANWVSCENKDTNVQLERIPEFYATANLAYRHGSSKFGADLMTRYTGDIYERGLAPFADVNYGHYFVADTSVFYRFGKENQHKLTLRVENILDRDYATRYNRVTNGAGTQFLYHQYGLARNIILNYTYTF